MSCLCVLSLPASLSLVESGFSEVFSHKTQARLWFRACSCFFPSLFLSFSLSTFFFAQGKVSFTIALRMLLVFLWRSVASWRRVRVGLERWRAMWPHANTHIREQRKHTHACLLRGIDGGDRDISSQAVVKLEKTKRTHNYSMMEDIILIWWIWEIFGGYIKLNLNYRLETKSV